MIFDTHAHYDDEAFDADREEILAGLSSHGIKTVVNIGVDIPTSKSCIALAEQYDFIYAVIGFHPENIFDIDAKELQDFRRILQRIHGFCQGRGGERQGLLCLQRLRGSLYQRE